MRAERPEPIPHDPSATLSRSGESHGLTAMRSWLLRFRLTGPRSAVSHVKASALLDPNWIAVRRDALETWTTEHLAEQASR